MFQKRGDGCMAMLLNLPHPHISSIPLYIQWRSLSGAASTLPVNRHVAITPTTSQGLALIFAASQSASSDGKRHLTRELGITLHQGAKFVASGRELQNLGRNSLNGSEALGCGTWLTHILKVPGSVPTYKYDPNISHQFLSSNACPST